MQWKYKPGQFVYYADRVDTRGLEVGYGKILENLEGQGLDSMHPDFDKPEFDQTQIMPAYKIQVIETMTQRTFRGECEVCSENRTTERFELDIISEASFPNEIQEMEAVFHRKDAELEVASQLGMTLRPMTNPFIVQV